MKPSDLLIGLRELFAFVVPGAAFLILLPAWLVEPLAETVPTSPLWVEGEAMQLLVFFFAAYTCGAMLSAIGSLFDGVAEKAISLRSLVPGLSGSAVDDRAEVARLEVLAGQLEDVALAGLPVRPGGKLWGRRAFWWNYLRKNCPQAVAEIDRIEAQQKLFRSLFVALLLLAALYEPGLPTVVFVGLAVVSFFYYAGLRRHLSRRLFQSAVILFAPSDLAAAGGDAA